MCANDTRPFLVWLDDEVSGIVSSAVQSAAHGADVLGRAAEALGDSLGGRYRGRQQRGELSIAPARGELSVMGDPADAEVG